VMRNNATIKTCILYVCIMAPEKKQHIKSGMLAVSSCHFATAYRDSKAI
jgi:hypothetical protein